MTTGQRIQKARKAAGLSQKELGLKLEVSGSMIGQYENDLRKPKLETLQKIASALEVPVAYLLGSMNDKGAIDLGLTVLELSERLSMEPSIIAEAIDTVDPQYPITVADITRIRSEAKRLYLKKRIEDAHKEDLKQSGEFSIAKTIAESLSKEDDGMQELLLQLKKYLELLNDDGQGEAIKRIQELTMIPKYQRKQEIE